LTILAADGTTVLDTIQLAGNFAGKFFHLSDGGSDGTYVTEDSTPCYLRGTSIRTAAGDRRVEDLRIGDLIVAHGGEALPLKWIGRRGYRDWLSVGNAEVQPILFKAGSLADGIPARDLYVSPEHAMFLDGMLVPAHLLVNGRSIVKCEGRDDIEYFHLEFDRHVVIFAERAAAESFVDDDSRMLFHNADEYRRLYPNEPRRRFAEFCAPRVENGPGLTALHQALAARARRLRLSGKAMAWERRGKVELRTRTMVAGWAYSGADAGPQALAILANGAVVGRVIADRYRSDLAAAGIGEGCHGFQFILPKGLAQDIDHRIEVRREVDWSLV
ncbi:MAG TPA: Hint domain-containing protein, partial [Alphaproteobacteria bacterium]|nr:Hint domain-containing protein [Alphaproteobacteria bacterium]